MTTSTGEEREQQRAPERGGIPADTFAVRLVLSRIHAGDLTLREAADRCGLSFASWSNWERGMKPRDLLDIIEAISQGLGIDRDWLMFGGPLSAAPQRRQLRRTRKGTLTQPYRTRAKFRPAAARAALHPEGVRRPVLLRDPLGVR